MNNYHIYRLINSNHKYLCCDCWLKSYDTTDVFINIINDLLGHTMDDNDPPPVVLLYTDSWTQMSSLHEYIVMMM